MLQHIYIYIYIYDDDDDDDVMINNNISCCSHGQLQLAIHYIHAKISIFFTNPCLLRGEIVTLDHYYPPKVRPGDKVNILLLLQIITFINLLYYDYLDSK